MTIKDKPIAFCGVIHFPHHYIKNLKKISRLVVLPDFQGFGFGKILSNFVGEFYVSKGFDLRISTSNPSIIYSFNRDKNWICTFQGHVYKCVCKSKISSKNSRKKILTTFKYKSFKNL